MEIIEKAKDLFKGEVKRTKNVYAIYDTKTELHAPPVIFENDGEAIRSVDQYVNLPNGDTPLHKFPNDYILMLVGKWEEKSGTIIGVEKKIVVNVGNLKKEIKKQNEM